MFLKGKKQKHELKLESKSRVESNVVLRSQTLDFADGQKEAVTSLIFKRSSGGGITSALFLLEFKTM